MRAFVSATIVLLGVICSAGGLHAEGQSQYGANLTAEAILRGLNERHGEDLHGFIIFLRSKFDKSSLSNKEIDRIVKRLLAIQESDPYHKVVESKSGKVKVFPNRGGAQQCIFTFRFQKMANSLRQLPIEERVNRIIDGIEHPPESLGYDATASFSAELVRAGREAVPFIIQHKPGNPYHRGVVVCALAAIEDPRGVDYIIEVLKTKDNAFRFDRPIAAKALAKFRRRKVVEALVEALQDQTFELIDRHLRQRPSATHKPYVGRYYSVQHAAAQSLTELTGKSWGLLYNEDYKTWSSWLRSDRRGTFSPASLRRSDKEVAKLVEYMFHRRMSGRPNPWQPQNILQQAEGIRSLSTDLTRLGPRVVPLTIAEYKVRIKETPLWKDELRQWTRDLLLSLDWKEARAAAESLTDAGQ
jgi:HEAT repeats